MHTTHTSVLARRVRVTADFVTLPYEAGWASEVVFFTQTEGEHPELTIVTEISPDGITWLPRGEPVLLPAGESIAANPLTVFGNWVRLAIAGATDDHPARVLVHAVLKG